MVKAIKDEVATYTSYYATSGSGDLVHVFILESGTEVKFCKKETEEGKAYVNWCRVYATPDEHARLDELGGLEKLSKKDIKNVLGDL